MLKIGYMTVTGESQGVLSGPSVYKLAPDTIEIVDIEHKVTREYDPAHGATTGDRHHHPLTVYKATDCTSPQLYKMCCDAELITEVKVQYYVQVGNAPDPVEFFSWTLQNAYVTEVRQIPGRELGGEYADQYDLLEAVSFSYQEILWEHYPHRAPIGLKDLPAVLHQDSWSSIQ